MDNTQLIILVASIIIVLAVIIGWQSFWLSRFLDAKFDAIDAKFDVIDQKFETVNVKLNGISKRLSLVETDSRTPKVKE